MSGRARIIAGRLGVIAIGLLLAATFIGGAAAADLKIGFTFSLTGGTDDYGKAARMGAELALKEYNDKGGYKGQKVEAVIYDDETKPAKGVENVTRLITRDKVFAIVGPVNSGVALAIIDIAQKNQIPLMDTIATAEQIIERYQNAPKSYIFRVSLNDGIQTSFMIDYIKSRKYQRIGLMHDSTGWGQSGRDTALRLLEGGQSQPGGRPRSVRSERLGHDGAAHQDAGGQGRFHHRLLAGAGCRADRQEHAEDRAEGRRGPEPGR